MKALSVLLLCVVLAACTGSGETRLPTAPSTSQPAPPIAALQEFPMQLQGFVTDTAYRPLAGARIEAVDGATAGASTVAGADGRFTLSGVFSATTRFRASVDGHEPRTQSWSCSVAEYPGSNNARPWLGFYLSVLEPTVDVAGDYRLTFIADRDCTDLPEVARTRSYRATVTARPVDGRSTVPGFDLKADGAEFLDSLDGFTIGAAGARLSLWLNDRHDPPIVEDLGGNTYLAFSGTAAATVGRDGNVAIDTAFDGWIEYIVLPSALGRWYWPQAPPLSKATCDSGNHRLTLTRSR